MIPPDSALCPGKGKAKCRKSVRGARRGGECTYMLQVVPDAYTYTGSVRFAVRPLELGVTLDSRVGSGIAG